MKIHTFEQRTPEWFEVRLGKFTGSDAQVIATNGKGLDTLVFEKVAERMTRVVKEGYTNSDMERGIALEDEARTAYELETGKTVTQCGFIEHNEYVGVSPDGLAGVSGLIEIKCPNDVTFVRYLYDQKIDPKYYAQMQMQMWVADREWCDYVVYNPNFENPIRIARVTIDQAFLDKLIAGVENGISKINKIMENL